jgi:hypothetical protein
VRHWWLLAALCAHFSPTGKYLKYIRNVLRMTVHKSSVSYPAAERQRWLNKSK